MDGNELARLEIGQDDFAVGTLKKRFGIESSGLEAGFLEAIHKNRLSTHSDLLAAQSSMAWADSNPTLPGEHGGLDD